MGIEEKNGEFHVFVKKKVKSTFDLDLTRRSFTIGQFKFISLIVQL